MALIATVQSRGQITLPKEAREFANIEPGDRLLVRRLESGRLELERMQTLSFAEMLDRLGGGVEIDVDEVMRATRAELERQALSGLESCGA